MRVVIYARISNDRTGAGLGVERQIEDCKLLAATLGAVEITVLSDNDLSAWSGKKRPDYERLLSGLRERRWDTLVAWHIDRLTRNPKDLEELVDVLNAGKVRFCTVKGGEVDLATPEGRLQARILGTLARYESDHKSDRIKRKMLQNAQNGQAHGRHRYGWSRVQPDRLHPDEAPVVEDLVHQLIRYGNVVALAKKLNADGVATPNGGPWTSTVVRKLVRRPANAGLVQHQGKVIVDEAGRPVRGTWKPIVTEAAWRAVCAVLDDPARRVSPGNQPAWLLSGLAVCGVPGCGAPMKASGGSPRSKGGVKRYRCSASHHVTREAAMVDQVVTDCVVDWLHEDEVTFDGVAGPVLVQDTEIEALRELVGHAELALLGRPPAHLKGLSLARMRQVFEEDSARLANLEREQALAAIPTPLEGVTAANFPGLPLERRRAVVDYLVDVAILPVGRGRAAREDSIEVTPKRRRA